jgi:transcriptional antiterminator
MKNFTKLDRHEYIFKKILNKEQLNTTEVAAYLTVTRKTIERDLKEWVSPLFEAEIYIKDKIWIIPECKPPQKLDYLKRNNSDKINQEQSCEKVSLVRNRLLRF